MNTILNRRFTDLRMHLTIFFENLEYDKVIDSATEKKLLFKKHGKSISIDDLSTGEKQIVFRGSYLLRNIGKLETAAIFIDEPELSMHPKWQQNILKYYKDLFKGADGLKSNYFLLVIQNTF